MIKSKKANVLEDLDIVKFIRTQRVNSICLKSLLTNDQMKFVEKLADSVLPVSTDSESENNRDKDFSYVQSVIAADDLVGKALKKMYHAPCFKQTITSQASKTTLV